MATPGILFLHPPLRPWLALVEVRARPIRCAESSQGTDGTDRRMSTGHGRRGLPFAFSHFLYNFKEKRFLL